LSTIGTKGRNRGEKSPVFFALRRKSDKNDFLGETFLLKLIFYVLEEYFLCALSGPVQQAIPTFGSYRAQLPILPGIRGEKRETDETKEQDHVRACGQVLGFLSRYAALSKGVLEQSVETTFTDYCLECEYGLQYFSCAPDCK
jgi:hypothetical protein